MGEKAVFLFLAVGLAGFMWFNYEITGSLDQGLGGLPLYDPILSDLDQYFFSLPAATFFQDLLGGKGAVSIILYDLLMLSYVTYYLLPFLMMLLIYRRFRREEHFLVGKFLASVYILCVLVFTSYLIFPVTGPQYFLSDAFTVPLPFSMLGRLIYDIIYGIHPTYIDCFPSGHASMAFLTCYWSYKFGLKERHLFLANTVLIALSTVLLRFHYTLDVLAAVPWAAISYLLAVLFYPWKSLKKTNS